MNAPTSFIRDTDKKGKVAVYWVLAENESESSPGKIHEVRTSKKDGKTYCTCRGWIVALNAGHSICCHIAKFNASKPTEKVSVMNKVEFESFKRGTKLVLGDLAANISNTVVRRK